MYEELFNTHLQHTLQDIELRRESKLQKNIEIYEINHMCYVHA